jgi:hypothetical protein
MIIKKTTRLNFELLCSLIAFLPVRNNPFQRWTVELGARKIKSDVRDAINIDTRCRFHRKKVSQLWIPVLVFYCVTEY